MSLCERKTNKNNDYYKKMKFVFVIEQIMMARFDESEIPFFNIKHLLAII